MMVWMGIVSFVVLISFAYVVLVLANKESANMKLAGQILAALIALFAVGNLFYHSLGGGCPMMDCSMKGDMMNKTMMK